MWGMYNPRGTDTKGNNMDGIVKDIAVENLEPGMLVGLGEAAKASKRPKFDEETILDFDAEWVEVTNLKETGSKIIVSVDRDYLPDVPVVKGTDIPVLFP